MRVLYVLDELFGRTAGTEGQFLELVTGMRARSIDVHVALLRSSAAFQELAGIPTTVLGVQSLVSPGAMRALWRLARDARAAGADVAHVFFNDASLACPIPLWMAGIPVVISRRDLGFWYTPGRLRLLRMNRRVVASVVANSAAVKQEVVRQERYAESKVTVIHNGWRLREISQDQLQVRSVLGIPAAAKMLLIVANLRPLKRVDDAIRIAAAALPGNRDLWLVVVGEDRQGASGSEQQRLASLARELGVADRVIFAGLSDNPWPIVSACDVGLLCSETEGLSNTLIEYSAAGKPVVCTQVGGNEEIVADAQSGYLYPVGKIEQAAARVAELLRDPGLGRRMGIVGRQLIASRFGIEQMVDSHLQLYASVARDSTGRSTVRSV